MIFTHFVFEDNFGTNGKYLKLFLTISFYEKIDQTILTNVDKPNQFKLVQTDQF